MMEDKIRKFTEEITIPCYCTDSSWRLKPASFMDYAQEAANRHASLIGFGYDDLIASKTAWVLSRMHIVFHRPPLWREKVTLSTWHKGEERLFYLRDFIMADSKGKALVSATTSWLVINLETRKLVRDTGLMDAEAVCRENAFERACDKVQMPKDIQSELVLEHKVAYADVDMNGHTNNAMYIVWAMNAVDYELVSTHPLKELKVNFNHETRPGDSVDIYKAVREEEGATRCFIEGKVGSVSAFCVELVF